MSNNNVNNNNQPNNPYELSNDNPYGHLPINNEQNGFLKFFNTTIHGQSSNHIVRNQGEVKMFKIGNEVVTVPEEYAEAFGALRDFWYNDMLGDYLVEQHNVLVDTLYTKRDFLENWKNEINFFLKKLATACTTGGLSPEYLNILVYNENYGIINLKDWLVNFCRSCTDINGTLKEPMCVTLEKSNKNFKCPPDYVCQTQQNWLTTTNVLTEEGLPTILYQNEGANFLLKKALEKYLDKISESPANSKLSTKELQEIIYNFKIASEQCRQGLHHNSNNTLINMNTTDIPYELPDDNPTVTKSDKNSGAAVLGGVLGTFFGIAAVCIIYGGCKYYKEEKSFFSSLKRTCGETWDKIKTFFNNCCNKKRNNETNHSIRNGEGNNKENKNNNTGKSRNNIGSTVIVNNNNNEDIATSKGEFNGNATLYKDKNGKTDKAAIKKGMKELKYKENENRKNQHKRKQGEESIGKGQNENNSNLSSNIADFSILRREMAENIKEVNEKNSEMEQKEINNNEAPVNTEKLNKHLKSDGSGLNQ